MNMEKRAFIAVVLSVLVWFTYNYFFLKDKIQQPQQAPAVTEESPAQQPSTSQVTELTQVERSTLAPPSTLVQNAVPAAEVVIETDLYRAVISNEMAVLRSFQLKRYFKREEETKKEPKANEQESIADDKKENEIAFHELVPETDPRSQGQPFYIQFDDQALSRALYETNFLIEGNANLTLNAEHPKDTITMSRTLPDGVRIQKTFTFSNDTYLIDMALQLTNPTSNGINLKNLIVLGEKINKETGPGNKQYGHVGPATFLDGKVVRTKLKGLEAAERLHGKIAWVALSDVYFFVAMLPVDDGQQQVEIIPQPLLPDQKPEDRIARIGLWDATSTIEPNTIYTKEVKFFLGPKEFNQLEKIGYGLSQVIDFGTFAIFARWLLKLMNYFYSFTHNYGVSIILLTMLIRLIFVPLSYIQMKSMREMSTLQPEVNRIKNKYKKEPQTANQEIMKLYKEHNVNPAMGCLPMMLQLPVFFALYSLLMQAIELRGAPFFLWITDLSAKDPTKITPILMGISMFFQQKLTPSTADPTQKRIFMLMPIFMTVIFLNFPSGLVIYWLVSNLLSLSYQGLSKLYKQRTATKVVTRG